MTLELKLTFIFGVLLSFSTLLSACIATTEYEIPGTWEYVMTDSNENTYDAGTITFEGTDTKGTYTQINIYEVEYTGTYTVNGAILTLTGDESWDTELLDKDHISGTWNHDDETANGTLTATRIP